MNCILFLNRNELCHFFSFFVFVIIVFFEGGSFLHVYVTFVFVVCLFVFVVVVFLSCLLRICLLICILENVLFSVRLCTLEQLLVPFSITFSNFLLPRSTAKIPLSSQCEDVYSWSLTIVVP